MRVFTDGGCQPDGLGSWAFVAVAGLVVREEFGTEEQTTNNKMELRGVIRAIEAFPKTPLLIFSDSQYVVKGVLEWLPVWKRNYWMTSSKEPVKNKAIWQELDALVGRHQDLQFQWVKGHRLNEFNNRADELCTYAMAKAREARIEK